MKRLLQTNHQFFFVIFASCTILLCTNFHSIFAQKSPIKWGEVSPSDILMEQYEADTSAEAVVLCDYSTVEIFTTPSDYGYYRYHHKRVKILKKSALDRGNISIPYYSKQGIESIRNLKAQVISPAGQITVLDKKDVFREEINEYWSSINFSFANLQEGSIFEYHYELHSKYMEELRTWYFQEDIPVRWSEYRVKNTSYFSYALLFEGGDYMEHKDLPEGGTLFQKGDTKIHLLDGRYIMENAPGLKEEAYVTTMNDYRARIRFQLSEVVHPGGHREPHMSTWEELADELLQDGYFGERFLKKRNYKKLAEAANPSVSQAGSKDEKIAAIYHFITNSVNWDETFGIFTDRSLDDAFETKLASASELNMMCLALLNHFEIEATPLLTSTRSHGKMTQQYPIRKQFNHLMVLVELEGKATILDLGDPLRPIGLPRESSLNKMAWKVDKEKPGWVEMAPILSREIIGGGLEISPEGDVKLKLKASYTNYSAHSEKVLLRNDPKGNFWKKRLESNFEEARIDSISFQNAKNSGRRLSTILNVTYPNAIDTESDFIYFSPVLFTNFSENPFKQKERTYPVDFLYTFEEKYMLSIKIPEGYEVEELPEKIATEVEGNKARFLFSTDQKGDRIQLISQLSISQLLYTPDQYQAIKTLFDLVVEKHGEQIVLKKKT